MAISVGDVVSVRHYSGARLYKSVVTDKHDDVVTIRLSDDVSSLNFSESDPIVIGYESEKEVHIASCSLFKVDADINCITLRIDNSEVLANKRLSERFPVSFLANMHIGQSNTTHEGFVRNISFSGMLISSKADFPIYQKLKITVHVGKKLDLQAIVVRKAKDLSNYQYGLKIVYTDINTPNLLKKYLILLKKEQEEFLKKFKNS